MEVLWIKLLDATFATSSGLCFGDDDEEYGLEARHRHVCLAGGISTVCHEVYRSPGSEPQLVQLNACKTPSTFPREYCSHASQPWNSLRQDSFSTDSVTLHLGGGLPTP